MGDRYAERVGHSRKDFLPAIESMNLFERLLTGPFQP